MKRKERCCCGLLCRCAAAAQKRGKGGTHKLLLWLLKTQAYIYFWWFSFDYLVRRKREIAKILDERPSILKQGRPDSKHLIYDLGKAYRSSGGIAPVAMMVLYALSRSCPADAYPIIQKHLSSLSLSKSFLSRIGHRVILTIYRAFLQKAQKERLNEKQFSQFVTELEAL